MWIIVWNKVWIATPDSRTSDFYFWGLSCVGINLRFISNRIQISTFITLDNLWGDWFTTMYNCVIVALSIFQFALVSAFILYLLLQIVTYICLWIYSSLIFSWSLIYSFLVPWAIGNRWDFLCNEMKIKYFHHYWH